MSFNLSKQTITAIVVLAICLIFDVLAVYLSYVHKGMFICFSLGIAVLILNLIIALLFLFKLEKTACTVSLILFFAIVPNELLLEVRHFQIKQECNNIISFLDSQKKVHGVFPGNLSAYTFVSLSNKNYIVFHSDGKNGYQLRYDTGSPLSAMHFYNYNSGYGWQFCDD
ncbi:hypothetical protein Q765_15245 [Flavobacterium rivuli WB 3.3-2 = DSM 21788]|uniref:Uncharacterized protein n=1 Tax=Flavobacterium rivuli WB 3.3-2 = DSM 21788 TaxID=1121895 RepID=A0A0A2MBB1_9FLAO|nr:hypothetical protein [Flavobacterium rivuli]KGO85565.1 hypothetical protein Q765_15245 [Flavobacterium rivuli WB 3.3-2 = DSM 21788]